MSHFLSGFRGEMLKLASFENGPVPLILTKNPDEATLRRAMHDVKRHEAHDESWKEKVHAPGGPVSRNYLASMLIGAAAAPMTSIIGKGLGRVIRNRAVLRAARHAGDEARRLELLGKVEKGPLIGRFHPDTPANMRPAVDSSELGGRVAAGVMTGSLVSALRDHFSGARPKNVKTS